MAFNRTYNAGNVKEHPEYAVLPAGEYPVQIVATEDKISRNTGKDMIELTLEVTGGDHKGAKLWQYICDDQYADQKIHDILTACGRPIPQSVNSTTFRGLCGKVKTKLREYNGEQKPEINYWIRPRAGDQPAAAPAPAPQNTADDIPF